MGANTALASYPMPSNQLKQSGGGNAKVKCLPRNFNLWLNRVTECKSSQRCLLKTEKLNLKADVYDDHLPGI